ncbi:MAG TPA: sugar phosphate isomerase/epimerase family protein [Bacilli bacterium]|jgi:sugar phosphate isomerase/epimerase|nr:sugar phosphate isomerase/epimerase family protein [Bacilli bacterium]HOD61832.1 sugar phosphate isomerase/epimerase family protein [Bacilli bacterium]HOH62208.1 sugar phosphate isomerase/epimerase family protein [Bacilli bacterium]HPB49349.1 sugar phosphate isomerase/epimerase family protein [Bacilli bacterium]HPM15430.1 sugar phosphate isomerase/epimerase family protein [Bacilli bacterium]
MKKCFTINPFRTDADFLEFDKILATNIFQGIEIFYPYSLPKEAQEKYRQNIEKLHRKYPHIEVVMHLPYGKENDLCNLDRFRETMQILQEGIVYTHQFQTKKLTLHLGYVDEKRERSFYLDHIVPILQQLCDYAQKYEMAVMIENMPGSAELGFSPEEILTIITKTARKNLKFILDTGHAHVSRYENPAYIQLLGPYLCHIHFSDNDQSGDQHKRMGLGNIDFKEVFYELNKIDYQELHCLEIIFHKPEEVLEFAMDMDSYQESKEIKP